ncbi:unnamed protein product [Lupinus luteus]|uniref:Uncharacterized protein n=1 Tax=Lupinus luteus TaxID=3873 RepID=A0AAV1XU74_LUPLU
MKLKSINNKIEGREVNRYLTMCWEMKLRDAKKKVLGDCFMTNLVSLKKGKNRTPLLFSASFIINLLSLELFLYFTSGQLRTFYFIFQLLKINQNEVLSI